MSKFTKGQQVVLHRPNIEPIRPEWVYGTIIYAHPTNRWCTVNVGPYNEGAWETDIFDLNEFPKISPNITPVHIT